MRFADIVLDVAAVAKASRSVASRHLELRARQIDRYGRTSSILKPLRENQNDAQHNADSTSTNPAGKKANTDKQEPSPANAPASVGVVGSIEPGAKASVASSDSFKGPKPIVNQDIRRNSPLEDAAPRLDQSAILMQLREKAKPVQDDEHKGASSEGGGTT
ncbi:hypothetical protein O1611_g7053 [Lasiodiplodia mahajangana]|uniref:Uncharacterized protein n=1 Tax=Lasiodiplodia mahajangana TaxID=1108764 RepID=A0ACC2JGM5_9PEZI|nr:hypothetical protein O1611_g7053 [Lasiodiplodia mahajangana]